MNLTGITTGTVSVSKDAILGGSGGKVVGNVNAPDATVASSNLNVTGSTGITVTVSGGLNGTGATGAVILASGTLKGTLTTGAISGTGLVSPGCKAHWSAPPPPISCWILRGTPPATRHSTGRAM